METTPNGNERVIIQILPYEPKYKNSDDEERAEVSKMLGLLVALILMVLFYFFCN